nr:type II toxin-antitoxin system RelE/ParE family toxin [uncultured Noviherbaspirillum sp.]
MKDAGFDVALTEAAAEQLFALFLYKVERSSLDAAIEARDAIEYAIGQLGFNPYLCPMAADDPTERKLVIPFGRKTGYLALFSIESDALVLVTAIRHQLEDDALR